MRAGVRVRVRVRVRVLKIRVRADNDGAIIIGDGMLNRAVMEVGLGRNGLCMYFWRSPD